MDLLLGHFSSFVFSNQADSCSLIFTIQLKIYDNKNVFLAHYKIHIYIYIIHIIIFLDQIIYAFSDKMTYYTD